jgi:acyl-CoA thioester hydrolase
MPSDAPAKPVFCQDYKVQIFDTDCYGVMWHGAYTKWLEMGRVGLLEQEFNLSLKQLSEMYDIIFPVYEQSFRYVQSARLDDRLQFRTSLDIQRPKWVFTQNAYRVLPDSKGDSTEELVMASTAVIVLVSTSGKVYRQIPEILSGIMT